MNNIILTIFCIGTLNSCLINSVFGIEKEAATMFQSRYDAAASKDRPALLTLRHALEFKCAKYGIPKAQQIQIIQGKPLANAKELMKEETNQLPAYITQSMYLQPAHAILIINALVANTHATINAINQHEKNARQVQILQAAWTENLIKPGDIFKQLHYIQLQQKLQTICAGILGTKEQISQKRNETLSLDKQDDMLELCESARVNTEVLYNQYNDDGTLLMPGMLQVSAALSALEAMFSDIKPAHNASQTVPKWAHALTFVAVTGLTISLYFGVYV